MRFKLDENLPIEAAALMRDAGHDAVTSLEQKVRGCSDADLAALCRREARALVTLDTDFADIRAYPPDEYGGLLVFRLREQHKAHLLGVLHRLLPLLSEASEESLAGQLWIVEEERVRVRASRRRD